MNYRVFPEIYEMLTTVHKFFEQSHSETIRTFMRFNLTKMCETLADEQFKLAVCVFNEKNFVT